MPDRLERFAFGSCNKQDHLQSHWDTIRSKSPQGWIWMGDSIYADETPPRVRAREYRRVLQDKAYERLLESAFILGTWDDHDYASNDARSEYILREVSQQLYLDFIGEEADSPLRLQKGIYQSKDIGKEGQSIQVILLDMRYFSEAPGTNADPLGIEQWAWLEKEILKAGPQLKVIISSIQFLTTDTEKETWASFPEAQSRLISLIGQSPVQTIVLSGDRHLAEFSRKDMGDGRTLHEITASGLTHYATLNHSNEFRHGETIHATNFGLMDLNWIQSDGISKLESIVCGVYSPQTGELLHELIIPITWA